MRKIDVKRISRVLLANLEAVIWIIVIVSVAVAGTWIYHMTATVGVSTTVRTYQDAGCTQLLPPDTHNWGEINNGDVKNVWIKNEGNVPLNVTITILNEVGCTITPNPAFIANLGIGATTKIALTINTGETGGSGISWDLEVFSEEA